MTKNSMTLTIVLICFPSLALASITGLREGSIRNHKSLIGHTGQDPVYKSTQGKEIPSLPTWKKEPVLTKIDTDVYISISGILIETPAWTIGQTISSIDFYSTELPYIDTLGSTPTYGTDGYVYNSNGYIPAPAAFVLLIGGLFTRTRRKI